MAMKQLFMLEVEVKSFGLLDFTKSQVSTALFKVVVYGHYYRIG